MHSQVRKSIYEAFLKGDRGKNSPTVSLSSNKVNTFAAMHSMLRLCMEGAICCDLLSLS